MEHVPDAPYIREAENDGIEGPDIVPECPICGEECEMIYLDRDGNEVGCEHCIQSTDAWQWIWDHMEDEA